MCEGRDSQDRQRGERDTCDRQRGERDRQRGKALLWVLLGLTLALGVALLLLLTLMNDSAEQATEQATEHRPDPHPDERDDPFKTPGPLPPRRLGHQAGHGSGGVNKATARYRTYLKTVKRDAALDPWEESEGDGPHTPVTIAVASSRQKVHPEVLTAIREELNPKIASCYRRRLRAKPDLKGKISVSFTLALKDRDRAAVSKSRIEVSKIKDAPMDTCVLRALSSFTVSGQLANETARNHITFALGRGVNSELPPRHPMEPPPKEPPEEPPKHPPEPPPKHPPEPPPKHPLEPPPKHAPEPPPHHEPPHHEPPPEPQPEP